MPRPTDVTDTAILSALQADARLTVAQLAERVRLSTSPAWRRVKRLENDGLITGYHAAISRRGLGWGVLAFVSVAIESHSEQEARAFETAVAALPRSWPAGVSPVAYQEASASGRCFGNSITMPSLQ